MIHVTTTYQCRVCGSTNITKNGTNKCGQAQYHCKDCGAYRVLRPRTGMMQRRAQVLQTYQERTSLRGLQRIFGVARQTVLKWIAASVQQLPTLVESLLPKERGDILELDEAWSFVCRRSNKRWLWTALCRRTRQIVGLLSEIVTRLPVRACGSLFRLPTVVVVRTAIFSGRIKPSCPNALIIQWVRKAAKRPIRSGGI